MSAAQLRDRRRCWTPGNECCASTRSPAAAGSTHRAVVAGRDRAGCLHRHAAGGHPGRAYRLRAALYDPLTLAYAGVATIEDVTQPVVAPLPRRRAAPGALSRDRFEAVTAAPDVTQGDALPVAVEWTYHRASGPEPCAALTLRDGARSGRPRRRSPPARPAAWTPASGCGAFAVSWHRLPIPDDLPGGEYRLASNSSTKTARRSRRPTRSAR